MTENPMFEDNPQYLEECTDIENQLEDIQLQMSKYRNSVLKAAGESEAHRRQKKMRKSGIMILCAVALLLIIFIFNLPLGVVLIFPSIVVGFLFRENLRYNESDTYTELVEKYR